MFKDQLSELKPSEQWTDQDLDRPKTRSVHDQREDKERKEYKERQKEVIKQQISQYNPQALVVFDLDFGHTHPTAPIPLGGRVVIDGQRQEIKFSEPD